MGYAQPVILGIVQGLTEFLPVSSSGHLVLAERMLTNFQRPGVCLEILLHMGTLISLIAYFRGDLRAILADLFAAKGEKGAPGRRWALLIVLGSIPTALIGFLFEGWFERMFSSVSAVGISLMITGLLLWVSDRVKGKEKGIARMTVWDSLGIGFVQGLAITPGISRSGSTIAMGIFLGLDRDTAARFSFLLSIPALCGALLFKVNEVCRLFSFNWIGYMLGACTAAVVGYISIIVVLRMVLLKKLSPFAYYCWAVAVIALFLV
ncbi:MAG: undecaprenyl-diphosphate phosphatase [bacterium]